jgi:hypothetical protein
MSVCIVCVYSTASLSFVVIMRGCAAHPSLLTFFFSLHFDDSYEMQYSNETTRKKQAYDNNNYMSKN